MLKQLKFHELSVEIKISQLFSIFVSTFVLSLSLSLSLCLSPYFSCPCPCPLVLLEYRFVVGGSPWVLVVMFCPWSHPSSFGSLCAGLCETCLK